MMDLIFSLGRSEIICANSVNFAIGSSRVWSLTTKVVIFCLSDYFLFSFFRFYLGQYCFRCDILPDAANKGTVDFDDFGFLFTFAINMARASDRGLRTQCRA